MIGIETLVQALLFLIIVGIVFWLLWWLIGYVGLPEPFAKVANVLLAVAAVFIVIGILLSFAGHPIIRFGP